MPRGPRPIQLESRLAPANNSLRMDQNQRLLPSTPDLVQQHPERSFGGNQARLRMSMFQGGELLPKSQITRQKVAARAKESGSQSSRDP